MPAVLSDVVTDLVTSVGKLRADDRLITSQAQKLNELETLRDAITSLEAEMVRRLRDVHVADAAAEVTGRTTKGWLREDLFLSGAASSQLMRCVHRLPGYPLVQAAFDDAEISLAHVLALMTALAHLPGELRETVEPLVVEHARFCPPEEIAAFMDELLEGLGIDKASAIRREKQLAERGVDLHPTLDGMRALHGTLTPDVGADFAEALAQASKPSGDDDDRTPRQRQHDALGAIARAYLGTNGAPSFTGAPRTVIVTMDLETLENSLREKWLRLPDGATISAATARRWACEAEIIPVVLGSKGQILDAGAANQEFTAAQRRAAYARDGGRCAFPGCRGRVAELHHIWWRRHGGPATIDNAAWLCCFHHHQVHEGGWTLERDPVDKSYLWTGPHGQQRRRHLTTA